MRFKYFGSGFGSLAVCSALVLSVSACGDGSDSASTTSSTAASTNAESSSSTATTTGQSTPSTSTGTPVTTAPPSSTVTGTIVRPLAITGTPSVTAQVNQAYSFIPTATAPTGQSLTFAIANKPAWATFNTSTGSLSGTPAAANVGTFSNIDISASSNGTTVSLASFAIQVKAVVAAPVTLASIALLPLTLQLAPGATQQITVTGTFSNATTQSLPASGESFQSSNSSVATVSVTGLVTISGKAGTGAKATITATDTATHLAVSAAGSVTVTVIAATGAPLANSAAAATATVTNNPLCGSPVEPFYWEIGDASGTLVSGSKGADSTGKPIVASTSLSIASASKWIYSTYVTQLRGAAGLSAGDINFLHFTSGYMNMDDPSTACPNTDDPDSVNSCLKRINSQGISFSAQTAANVGKFYYNGGHMENHASQMTTLGNLAATSLGKTMQALLGSDASIQYTEPLMSGGILASAQQYIVVLRHILDGSLLMHGALGTEQVCTHPSAACNAAFSPIKEAWHYSIGHWVENDPATNGDGAFSSPGAFGFYPWIDATKTYYGVISRSQGTGSGEQQGYASAQCGRLIRHAWMTGVEQTQSVPTD